LIPKICNIPLLWAWSMSNGSVIDHTVQTYL
jgi:hypothetical protein